MINSQVKKPWYREIAVGQMLNPIPLLNQTERGPNRLTVPTEILDIKNAQSQSGVMFKVRSKGGTEQWLDAAWFEIPVKGSSTNERNLLETDDGKWDGVIRAFWRRIQRFPDPKFNNQLELPDPLPCEFRAHFATALLAAPEELRNLAIKTNQLVIMPDELEALQRFNECVTDGEGYDIDKNMMKRLAVIGVVRRVTADIYEHTEFGCSVLKGELNTVQQSLG